MVIIHHCNFYRPQRSCGKVMFLHLSVSHSVHGGCLADTPSPRSTPWKHPPEAHPPETIPPRSTPLPSATAADGSHPTGMLSC